VEGSTHQNGDTPVQDCTKQAHDEITQSSVAEAYERAVAECRGQLHPSAADELLSVIQLFSQAEKDLKSAEIIDSKHRPLVPAINELRYCSHHLFKAYSSKDVESQLEEIRRAKRHCERAIYDCLNITLAHLIMRIEEFKATKIPSYVTMTQIIPSWVNDNKFLIECQRLFDSDYKEKIEQYDTLRQHLVEITDFYETLLVSESEISKYIVERNTPLKISLIALLATATIAAAAWYKILMTPTPEDTRQVQLSTETAQASVKSLKIGQPQPLPTK